MNTEQAFDKLKEAGVTDSIQTVRRWLRDGVIKATRSENRKAGYIIDQEALKEFINERTGRDKDEQIKELEKEVNRLKAMIQKKERGNMSKENRRLQLEVDELRSENLNLKMKLSMSTIEKSNMDTSYSSFQSIDYNKKLGLSDTATNEEVLAKFKELIMACHPDKGGDAKTFQYIKADYDNFRNSIKV